MAAAVAGLALTGLALSPEQQEHVDNVRSCADCPRQECTRGLTFCGDGCTLPAGGAATPPIRRISSSTAAFSAAPRSPTRVSLPPVDSTGPRCGRAVTDRSDVTKGAPRRVKSDSRPGAQNRRGSGAPIGGGCDIGSPERKSFAAHGKDGRLKSSTGACMTQELDNGRANKLLRSGADAVHRHTSLGLPNRFSLLMKPMVCRRTSLPCHDNHGRSPHPAPPVAGPGMFTLRPIPPPTPNKRRHSSASGFKFRALRVL
jgi:hypothetical protein